MITCIHIIYPDEPLKSKPDEEGLSLDAYKKKMRYCTSSRDGTVKIWNAVDLKHIKEIKVTDGIWVTCQYAQKNINRADFNGQLHYFF